MKTIKELRKDIKKLGYSIRFNNNSYGKHAVYIHDATKDSLTYNVCSDWTKWQPLKNYLFNNDLQADYYDKNGNKIHGIVPKVFKEI